MLKCILLLLVPSFTFAYPELVTKNCLTCHSESSGSGVLTAEGKANSLSWADHKSESYFEIKTPQWIMLGLKADLNQTLTKSPYEKTGSFKATRFESQLGLVKNVSKYLSVHAQGSLNRVDPKTKSDAITDYVYSPYRFVAFDYYDPMDTIISLKHGYYRNEWQNEFALFSQSFKQSELIYLTNRHQVSLGFKTREKTFNESVENEASFITYKFFSENKINLILGHERNSEYQFSSIWLIIPKNDNLTIKTFVAQTVSDGLTGFRGRVTPVYRVSSFLKFYGFADYANPDIETAKPRTIVYGLGADYLVYSQGLLSVNYTKTDDSMVINNPIEKLELNFHFYM